MTSLVYVIHVTAAFVLGAAFESWRTNRKRIRTAKIQTVEAFEIHNRFCGENGEPCQFCRLKAEREEK